MNTYRKATNSTSNVTSNSNGWIETPRNRQSYGFSPLSYVKELALLAVIVKVALILVPMLVK